LRKEVEETRKWSFWERLRWRLKAFRYMGIVAFFFPYSDGGFAHVIIPSFYTAATPLLAAAREERAKAPFLEEVFALASELIEPYLYGEERGEKRGSVEKVYIEAEKMFSYLKELEQREPYAAWLLREIIAGYLADIATAFAFLYKIEKRKEFRRLQEFFEHLMFAFGDLDERELNLARDIARNGA
jgi:formate/nitrite transporter FocA (FNT family)